MKSDHSQKNTVLKSPPHSEVDAVCQSETPSEWQSLNISKDEIIAILVGLLITAYQETPSSDKWYLIIHSALRKLTDMGIPENHSKTVINKFIEMTHRTRSYWPKGFF